MEAKKASKPEPKRVMKGAKGYVELESTGIWTRRPSAVTTTATFRRS